jgi:hypothetical protein
MEKSMEPLTVKTHQGKIFMEQPDNGEGRACIAIDPSQVPMLIAWLEDAAKELLKTTPGNCQNSGPQNKSWFKCS